MNAQFINRIFYTQEDIDYALAVADALYKLSQTMKVHLSIGFVIISEDNKIRLTCAEGKTFLVHNDGVYIVTIMYDYERED